jgi:hypothetical protein
MKVQLKGDTPEKKFKHLERIIERMSRRLQKTVIGLLPVAPIFGHVTNPMSEVCILSALFPADGAVTHVALKAEGIPKGTTLDVRFRSGGERLSKTFVLKNTSFVEKIEHEVRAGDLLEAFVEVPEVKDEEDTGQVWVGILYQISMKDSIKTPIAIEQFEQLTGDFDASED